MALTHTLAVEEGVAPAEEEAQALLGVSLTLPQGVGEMERVAVGVREAVSPPLALRVPVVHPLPLAALVAL